MNGKKANLTNIVKSSKRSAGKVTKKIDTTSKDVIKRVQSNIIRATANSEVLENSSTALRNVHASNLENIVNKKLKSGMDYRRFTGLFITEDFDSIRTALHGSKTLFDWGDHLNLINSQLGQKYFRNRQKSDVITPLGIDPSTAGSYTWGNVILIIQHLKYSNRFGGSFHIRLIPNEKFGLELIDKANNIYMNLENWSLNVWLIPSLLVFNNPNAGTPGIIQKSYFELEINESETYEITGNSLIPKQQIDETLINNLIVNAENHAKSKLRKLCLFILCYVHNKHLPDFNSIGERITQIYLSDNLFRIEKVDKKPFIRILLNTFYFGTGALEGPLNGDAELIAYPFLSLKADKEGLVIMSNRRRKYIGSSSSTGYLEMGYLSLQEIEKVKYAIIYPSWKEIDYFSPHDTGSGYGIEFENLNFDKNKLESKSNANQLGQVGQELLEIVNDLWHDELTYAVRLKFELVKQ